jgi:hypothetical protein
LINKNRTLLILVCLLLEDEAASNAAEDEAGGDAIEDVEGVSNIAFS